MTPVEKFGFAQPLLGKARSSRQRVHD
jgi:hypothetical protein